MLLLVLFSRAICFGKVIYCKGVIEIIFYTQTSQL